MNSTINTFSSNLCFLCFNFVNCILTSLSFQLVVFVFLFEYFWHMLCLAVLGVNWCALGGFILCTLLLLVHGGIVFSPLQASRGFANIQVNSTLAVTPFPFLQWLLNLFVVLLLDVPWLVEINRIIDFKCKKNSLKKEVHASYFKSYGCTYLHFHSACFALLCLSLIYIYRDRSL